MQDMKRVHAQKKKFLELARKTVTMHNLRKVKKMYKENIISNRDPIALQKFQFVATILLISIDVIRCTYYLSTFVRLS